jgi:orotidine-5'-phosphate decarboxylase
MRFFERLRERIEAVDSVVCVGLDPDPGRLPDHLREHDLPRWAFNRRIIDATHEHAAAYKPNAAFYEDADGWRALTETIAYAHGKDVPVILDAKRADIGNTTRQYAKLLGDRDGEHARSGHAGVGRHAPDAITVNPYMGRDSLEPFLAREEKGVFVLCRTSNPGGADLQDLELASGEALYERVAALAELWNANDNVGLVVGATAPEELESLREQVPDLPFLVPGVGSQGGDAEAAVEFGLSRGIGLVNSSRGIVFAGEHSSPSSRTPPGNAGEGEGFEKAAGEAAKRLKRRLNGHR